MTFTPADLTVVIPTRDRWPILQRTIDALERQTVSGFDIIVVADGMDQTPPELPGVRVIVKEHGGPGTARNAGVRETRRDLILFLGDDMVPEPALVATHLARHNAAPEREVAVLGHVDWHPRLGKNPILSWFDWSSSQFDYRNITTEDAGWGRFYSSNVSLKRAFFESCGGFDEDFIYYYEDLDAGRRFGKAGMRLIYERRARALHDHQYTLESVISRFEGIARGEYMMSRRHDWFTPFFRGRIVQALERPPASPVWPKIVDLVPPSAGALRRRAEARADDWYHQRIGPRFLNAWEGARDLEELKTYLGDAYDEKILFTAADAVEREEEEAGDEETFYKTSKMYLYDLTAFAMTPTKVPYRQELMRVVPPGGKLLDWGCGIGSDGLRLIDNGYRMAFADFANPSTEYLRWRLARRGLTADVYDIQADDIPGGFDAAYSFDVIEHVDDPFAFLGEMEKRARLVIVNLLEPSPDDTHLHKPLPIPALLDHAEQRGLVRYRKYYGRSHLIIYGGSPTFAGRTRARAERLLGGRMPTA